MKKIDRWTVLVGLVCLAGVTNILGILAFSKMFSGDLAAVDSLFEHRGKIVIIVWGIVFFAAANALRFEQARYHIRHLFLALAIEKFTYFGFWIQWISDNSDQLKHIYEASWLAGLFFCSYGLIDLFFGGIFFITFICIVRAGKSTKVLPIKLHVPHRDEQ